MVWRTNTAMVLLSGMLTVFWAVSVPAQTFDFDRSIDAMKQAEPLSCEQVKETLAAQDGYDEVWALDGCLQLVHQLTEISCPLETGFGELTGFNVIAHNDVPFGHDVGCQYRLGAGELDLYKLGTVTLFVTNYSKFALSDEQIFADVVGHIQQVYAGLEERPSISMSMETDSGEEIRNLSASWAFDHKRDRYITSVWFSLQNDWAIKVRATYDEHHEESEAMAQDLRIALFWAEKSLEEQGVKPERE